MILFLHQLAIFYSGLDGVGNLEPGGVLLGDSQLHLHQEDSVGGGGGSGLFLIVTPFISFALSASILRLPEQTKTGATEALAGRGLST